MAGHWPFQKGFEGKNWRDQYVFAPVQQLTMHELASTLTNPQTMVAIAILFQPFLNSAYATGPQVVIMALAYGALRTLNHIPIAYCGSWQRGIVQSPRRIKWLLRAAGGACVGIGSLMAVTSRA